MLMPRPSRAAWLLLLLASTSEAADSNCGPYPIAARYGNVSLPNGKVARGVDIAVGEPAQHLAFVPIWHLNNTYLWGTNGNCILRGESTWSTAGCTTFRGGAFDPSKSTSKTEVFSSEAYAVDTSVVPATDNFLEKVALNSNDSQSVTGFPLGVALNDFGGEAYYPQQSLGVGSNSSILNSLWAAGKIASRTIGLYTGRGIGAPNQQDGSLVFGGYDKAKTQGRAYTASFNDGVNCSSNMGVTIADMQLKWPNGTVKSLFPVARKDLMRACLDPASPTIMRMPLNPYFSNWLGTAGISAFDIDRGLGYWYFNMKYEPGMPIFDGDLTITLQSGLSVTIPNDMIVQPHTKIDEQTGDFVRNASAPDWIIYSNQGSGASDTPLLGMQFFSAAYLMMNLDAKKFTLWEAKQTADQDLVAVDRDDKHLTGFCALSKGEIEEGSSNNTAPGTGSGGSGNGGGSGSGDGSGTENSSSSGLGTGAIAGVAVGSIAGVALIAAAAFFLWRRKRNSSDPAYTAASQSAASPTTTVFGGPPPPGAPGYAHSNTSPMQAMAMTSSPGSGTYASVSSPEGTYSSNPMHSGYYGQQYPPGFQWKTELDSQGQQVHEMPAGRTHIQPMGPVYEMPGQPHRL